MPSQPSWPPLRRVAAFDPSLAEELARVFEQLSVAAEAMIWAEQHLSALIAAPGPSAVLTLLVDEARALVAVPEVWALTWTGSIGDGTASVRAFAGDKAAVPAPAEISRTIVGQAVQSGRPVWVDDALTDVRFGDAPSVLRGQLRAVGCVPIGKQGALYLYDPESAGRFPIEVQARLTALCQIIVPFLDAHQTPVQPGPARPKPRGAPIPDMTGDSPAMQELYAAIRAFAPMPWPALILGETGTGKELVARALHALSPRKNEPLVAVNCGAIPEDLAESTLFGHEKGAFTGADRRKEGLVERVGGGTLFLDEVGELSPRLQVKLLRLVQESTFERVGGGKELKFHGRIIAATLRPLDELEQREPERRRGDPSAERRRAEVNFRADLYHRLAACTLRVPALRERREDIPALAEHLLGRALEALSGPPLLLTPAALHQLCGREWPGNVRELENALRGAVARTLAWGESRIGPEHFVESASAQAAAVPGDLLAATQAFQRDQVNAALRVCNGNRTRAAELLGVSRQWLHHLLARWES